MPRAQFVSRGTVRGELYDLGYYPGAIPSGEYGIIVNDDFIMVEKDCDLLPASSHFSPFTILYA